MIDGTSARRKPVGYNGGGITCPSGGAADRGVSGHADPDADEYAESVAAGEVGGHAVRVLPPRKLGDLCDERGWVGRDAADGSSGRGQIFRVVAGVGGMGLTTGCV